MNCGKCPGKLITLYWSLVSAKNANYRDSLRYFQTSFFCITRPWSVFILIEFYCLSRRLSCTSFLSLDPGRSDNNHKEMSNEENYVYIRSVGLVTRDVNNWSMFCFYLDFALCLDQHDQSEMLVSLLSPLLPRICLAVLISNLDLMFVA